MRNPTRGSGVGAAMSTRRLLLAVLLGSLFVLEGCGGSSGSTPPSATGAPMSGAELRLSLIDQLGPRWYCDPDQFPVARADEQQRAIERFPDLQAEGKVFGAIVARQGLNPAGPFTDAQKLAIYQVWKVATSIPFDPQADGTYAFDYVAKPAAGAATGVHTVGTIDGAGTIAITRQEAAGQPACPICLTVGTPIDTPIGRVAVERLGLGDPVWTLDASGRRIPAVVIAIGSTPAPVGHLVVHLGLADGRTVTASPGHPTADGRVVGDLAPGDRLDDSVVVSTDRVPDPGDETHDIAVSGPTGIYLADGIPLRSTLGAPDDGAVTSNGPARPGG